MKTIVEDERKKVIAAGRIVLVGNPNVGKSVLFGRLTGHYVVVSNYPGTTVDITRGSGAILGEETEVVDTPGILSLFPKSDDERVTRDVLLSEPSECVIQVADAKNLRRALLITMELSELKMPTVLVLNMSDEARARGIEINTKRLSEILKIPVIETVATTGEGMAALVRSIPEARVPSVPVCYLSEVEEAYAHIETLLKEKIFKAGGGRPFQNGKFAAETLLAGDASIWDVMEKFFDGTVRDARGAINSEIQRISGRFLRPINIAAMDSKQQRSGEIVAEVTQITGSIRSSWARTLGQWTMKPWPGYLIAGGVLFIMYELVGVFAAQVLVGWLENSFFGNLLNPAVSKIVEWAVPVKFFQEMLVGPYGLFTMALTYALAIILPIVSTFFLFFGFLEDSGYLPRLAVMLDRIFRFMGLNGKAVLPMILGLGCDTMATLTTRVLDTRKEKVIVTLLLTLSVPCSAQLGVMMGMVAALSWKVFAIWLGTVVGTMFAVGWASSKLLPGLRSPFLMEIPPIRAPQIGNIVRKVRARMAWYLREAVPLFMLGTFILFLSDKLGFLEWVKKIANPVVIHFLGLTDKSTESFVLGFLRRDYGAAGFFMLAKEGLLNPQQITVALIVITLFMPCIAQLFVSIKERGYKTALAIALSVMVFALAIGGLVNWILAQGLILL